MPSNWSGRILAHRCGMGRGTENTLEAIEQAHRDGADGFECDVRLTADLVPMVFHDVDLKRLTGWSNIFEQTTKKQLDDARLRPYGERIPSVAEVIDFVQQKSWRVTFEIKTHSMALVEKLVMTARDLRLWPDQYQLLAFSNQKDFLCKVRRHFPAVRTSVMFKLPRAIVTRSRQYGVRTACLGWLSRPQKWFFLGMAKFFHLEEQIKQAHQSGLLITAGITEESEALHYLVRLGVDAIYTNDVLKAKKIISKL